MTEYVLRRVSKKNNIDVIVAIDTFCCPPRYVTPVCFIFTGWTPRVLARYVREPIHFHLFQNVIRFNAAGLKMSDIVIIDGTWNTLSMECSPMMIHLRIAPVPSDIFNKRWKGVVNPFRRQRIHLKWSFVGFINRLIQDGYVTTYETLLHLCDNGLANQA